MTPSRAEIEEALKWADNSRLREGEEWLNESVEIHAKVLASALREREKEMEVYKRTMNSHADRASEYLAKINAMTARQQLLEAVVEAAREVSICIQSDRRTMERQEVIEYGHSSCEPALASSLAALSAHDRALQDES